MVGKWTWCWAVLALLVLLCAWLLRSTPEVQVPWSDAGFYYEGRWEENEADWPCTAVRFELEARAPVALVFSTGPMSRFNVSVIGPSGHHWQLWSSWLPGPASLPISEGGARASAVAGPPHPLRVELRKLSTSHPLGTGLGNRIATSRWAFHGLSHGPEVQLKLLRPQTPQRRIEFLGAADALGMEPLHPPEPPRALLGVAGLRHLATAATAWQRQSCQAAYPGLIAEKLQAEYHVQALAGVGVVQNAFHQVAEYVLGIPTWHHYYGRLCASRPAPPASSPRVRRKPAQLVVVHLGSDDFRGSVVPENNTFRVIYNKLLRSVIHFHGGYRQNLSLLALGSTNAAEHVEDAVRYFHETLDLYTDNTSVRVKYLQVHSSDALELAQEVLPTLRSFMGW